MIGRRLLAGLLFASFVWAVPAAVAASSPTTFHGNFSAGEGYWMATATPSEPVLVIPARGVWNLNVVGQDVTANFVVIHTQSPKYVEWIPKGLEAHWAQGFMSLEPVTVPFGADSPVGSVFPALAGRVNDPAAGSYLFSHYYPDPGQTIVAAYDATSEQFFYVGVPDQGFCPPPSDEVPFCFDAIRVLGSGR